MAGVNPPRPSLRVVIAIIRDDDVVIKEVSWQTALSRLIGLFIKALPKKRFGQDKRDAELMQVLNTAGQDYRKELLGIGVNPWVWTHKR